MASSPIDETYQPKVLKVDQAGKIRRLSRAHTKLRFSETESLISKVMVLYTGGTIGMVNENGSYVPKPNYLMKKLRDYSDLNDLRYVEDHFASVEVIGGH